MQPKFYFEITMGRKKMILNLLILLWGEQGNQWLTKPSFTFHNVSASAGFIRIYHELELVF
jgi:iron complex outermembrane receptor protein